MYYDQAKTLRMTGNLDVIDNFLREIDFTPNYISIPINAQNILPDFFKTEEKRLDMYRLIISKSDVSVKDDYPVIQLKKDQIHEALKVFQAAEPEDWMTTQAEKLPHDNLNQWYAIQKKGRLVSVCWNQIYPHGGHIAFIGTHPEHRRRGHASTLIKYSLSETFKQTDFAVIHVREDNLPALIAYRKFGYKDYLNYLVLCNPVML